MFKKLRNRLILINLSITTIVIVIVFSTIYLTSTRSADNRAPIPDGMHTFSYENYNDTDGDGMPDEMENLIITTIREEKRAAANQLLITLICSGFIIELSVALVSYLLAEEAIKPVREAYESQKVFIANASHEIKTPLAAIAANLEAADIHDNKWIANVEAETTKLTALNTSLLALARTDLVAQTTTEEVNLASVTSRALQSFEPRLGGRKLTKHFTLPEKSKIKINSADFTQILGILMDNAIKYSKHNITVTLTDYQLSVANDGTTIPKDQLPHIFERFYQVDKSAEGVGLGLSIAKSLAERNNWQLDASSDGGETKFVLMF